jgi:hypothetical protein
MDNYRRFYNVGKLFGRFETVVKSVHYELCDENFKKQVLSYIEMCQQWDLKFQTMFCVHNNNNHLQTNMEELEKIVTQFNQFLDVIENKTRV